MFVKFDTQKNTCIIMKLKHILSTVLVIGLLGSCKDKMVENQPVEVEQKFDYLVDQFADLKILRYQIPGFDEMTLKEKQLVYYMTQAGLAAAAVQMDHIVTVLNGVLSDVPSHFDGEDIKATIQAAETTKTGLEANSRTEASNMTETINKMDQAKAIQGDGRHNSGRAA